MRDHTKRSPAADGFALPATILALVVVGGLITGGVFIASQESQTAASGEYSTEAFLAAERGLAYAIGNMTRQEYEALDVGDQMEVTLPPETSGGVETASTIHVRSLGNDLYFVGSTGFVTGAGRYAGAAHRTGTVVRPINPDIEIENAVTTLGGVDVSGTGLVSGFDRVPDNWDADECPPLEDQPGIASTAPSATQSNPSKIEGVDTGNGPDESVVEDPSLHPDDFLGDLTYNDLAAAADFVRGSGSLQPSPSYNEDGTCDTTDPNNWGAPTGACANHFPVIHVDDNGQATMRNYGQGILLVDGDFVAQGGGRFNGILLVRGQLLEGSGNGGVTGAILVYNDGDPDSVYEIDGNGVALYSSCAIEKAVQNALGLNRIYPIVERNWVDLSGTGTLTY